MLLLPFLDVFVDEDCVQFLADGGAEAFRHGDVGSEEFWGEAGVVVVLGSSFLLVDCPDVPGEAEVVVLVGLVKQDENQVEPREEGRGQVDVLVDCLLLVVPAVEGIGRSKDRGSGVEGGGDARLGDGDCLLLHNLVDGCPVELIHFVELVNAADSHIGQH